MKLRPSPLLRYKFEVSSGSADEDLGWIVRDASGTTLIEGSFCGRCWLGEWPTTLGNDPACYSGDNPSPHSMYLDGYLYSTDIAPSGTTYTNAAGVGSAAITNIMKVLLPTSEETNPSKQTCEPKSESWDDPAGGGYGYGGGGGMYYYSGGMYYYDYGGYYDYSWSC